MSEEHPIREGQVVTGALFNEPMRVETVRASGPGTWVAGMVGIQTERFRKVTLSGEDIKKLTILDAAFNYGGDGQLLRLGIQAGPTDDLQRRWKEHVASFRVGTLGKRMPNNYPGFL